MMRVLDLFSGLGCFSLGLEHAGGFRTVRFIEAGAYQREVLARHWPGVRCERDVREAAYEQGEADVITAGFPCQDLSRAGGAAGLSGARSGLWREVVRAVRLVRPRYTILENVAELLSRGLGTVLGDLAEIGHDAEWHCIPKAAIGAPDLRDRIWIVAQPQHSDANGAGLHPAQEHNGRSELRDKQGGEPRSLGIREPLSGRLSTLLRPRRWPAEPFACRVDPRTAEGVERTKALGGVASPDIVEMIGRAILNCSTPEVRPGDNAG